MPLLLVGGGLTTWLLLDDDDTTDDPDPEPAAEAYRENGYAVQHGDPEAPREVVIYSDFACSHCAALQNTGWEDFERLAEEGKALFEYHPVAFLGTIGDDEWSMRATNAYAVVLDEAGAEVALEFRALAFAEFDATVPALDDDELIALAVEAGAEEADVTDPITSRAETAWVEDATEAAQEEGVAATPTVLVDGEPFEVPDGDWAAGAEELVDELE